MIEYIKNKSFSGFGGKILIFCLGLCFFVCCVECILQTFFPSRAFYARRLTTAEIKIKKEKECGYRVKTSIYKLPYTFKKKDEMEIVPLESIDEGFKGGLELSDTEKEENEDERGTPN